MENKFTSKVIRSFMEERMREQLVFYSVFTLHQLEDVYIVWREYSRKDMPSIGTLDDKIDFFNALMKYLEPKCTKYIQPDDGARVIEFFLDPCNRDEWNEAMNKIHGE